MEVILIIANNMRRFMITIPEDLMRRLEEVTEEFGYTKSSQIQTLIRRYLATEYDIKKERRLKENDAYKA